MGKEEKNSEHTDNSWWSVCLRYREVEKLTRNSSVAWLDLRMMKSGTRKDFHIHVAIYDWLRTVLSMT